MTTKTRLLRRAAAALALFMFATLAGCDAASGSSGQLSVSILEPGEGAHLTAPFTVRIKSSVPLGPSDSGKHHVHVYFDDRDDEYTIVESDTAKIPNVPAGEHTLHVSLRNANHSAAGAEASIKVTGGAGGGPTDVPDNRGGYGY